MLELGGTDRNAAELPEFLSVPLSSLSSYEELIDDYDYQPVPSC